MNKQPTAEQVYYIKKNYGNIPHHVMTKQLGVSSKVLSEWSRLAFNPKESTKKWRHIMQNLDYLEQQEELETELLIEYQIKDVSLQKKVTYRKVFTLQRMFYLVTIDQGYNFIVKFDAPVPINMVEYSPWPTGHDVTVFPLGHWEWMELKTHLPVIEVPTNGDYVGLFWCATKELLHEA
jgi:hypothetical protein